MKLISYIGLLFLAPALVQGASVAVENITPVSTGTLVSEEKYIPVMPDANRLSLRLYSGTSVSSTIMDTSCLELRGVKVNMNNGWSISISAWDKQVMLGKFYSYTKYTIAGEIANKCAKDVTGYIHVLAATPTKFWSVARSNSARTFPAMRSCSAVINDLNLGKVYKGTERSATLVITKSGNGNGTLNVEGEDMFIAGALHPGGDLDITVSPQNAGYIGSSSSWKGSWISDASKNSIPLKIIVGKNAKAGEHKSTLTATLTCE